MNAQEAADLKIVNDAVQQKKLNFWLLCEEINRASPERLKHMGQGERTQGEAMQSFFQSTQRDIEKVFKAHERRYPDAR